MTASVRHATHVASGEDVEPLWGGQWLAESEARHASEELREAMDRAIFKFGFRYGWTREQSRKALMDWELPE
jgi:hypothetical protein